MFFLQLPATMPLKKQHATTKAEEKASSSKPPEDAYRLEELPSGFMGKMLVYKSGAIKLKLGDMLYDVSTY